MGRSRRRDYRPWTRSSCPTHLRSRWKPAGQNPRGQIFSTQQSFSSLTPPPQAKTSHGHGASRRRRTAASRRHLQPQCPDISQGSFGEVHIQRQLSLWPNGPRDSARTDSWDGSAHDHGLARGHGREFKLVSTYGGGWYSLSQAASRQTHHDTGPGQANFFRHIPPLPHCSHLVVTPGATKADRDGHLRGETAEESARLRGPVLLPPSGGLCKKDLKHRRPPKFRGSELPRTWAGGASKWGRA